MPSAQSTKEPQSIFPDFTGTTIGLLERPYQMVEVIRTGGSGTVYRAVDLSPADCDRKSCDHLPCDRTGYVVKCMVTEKLERQEKQSKTSEFKFHSRVCDHPNIVTIHRVYRDLTYTYVVLDLVRGMDLHQALQESSIFYQNDELVRRIFLQIVDALQHCHQRGVYHCDLKADNILVSEDGTDVYLADFGLAQATRECRNFGYGTLAWMSPECLGANDRSLPFDAALSDIWSVGLVLLSILARCQPWRIAYKRDDTYFKLFRRSPEAFLADLLPITAEARSILLQTLTIDPAQRISLEQLRMRAQVCNRFFLSDDELVEAPQFARDFAAAYSVLPRHFSAKPNPGAGPEGENLYYSIHAAEQSGHLACTPNPNIDDAIFWENQPEYFPVFVDPGRQAFDFERGKLPPSLPSSPMSDLGSLVDVMSHMDIHSSTSSGSTSTSGYSEGPITPRYYPSAPDCDFPALSPDCMSIPLLEAFDQIQSDLESESERTPVVSNGEWSKLGAIKDRLHSTPDPLSLVMSSSNDI